MKRVSIFTITDLKRALKAYRAAGLEPGAVEIEPGKITIHPPAATAQGAVDEVDTYFKNREAKRHANQS
ncbi:hypothetical protein [Mesorhizobium sp. IMUNJ 23232]|uniref:hypothetical protein n=1 Tax=Mesorhizobium sp. IMUNJ 23232 TaxID=3376064 RepID=UPI0037972B13